MPDNKIIIRTSGFALVFFSILLGLCALALGAGVAQVAREGHADIIEVVGFAVGLWLVAFLHKWLFGQKIEVDGAALMAEFSLPVRSFMPAFQKHTIALGDISAVIVARLSYFEKNAASFQSESLRNMIEVYHGLQTEGGGYGLAMKYATPFTPLMLVVSKKADAHSFAVVTKPFSKNGFRRLLAVLKKRNVPVITEPVLGLQ
jgi:hypothetical protein